MSPERSWLGKRCKASWFEFVLWVAKDDAFSKILSKEATNARKLVSLSKRPG
jgi:hypothetical protein